MQWIVHNIEDLMKKTGYVDKQNAEKYTNDKQLIKYIEYWAFFDEKAKEIHELTKVPFTDVLYSKFYWGTQFVKRHEIVYGDEGNWDDPLFDIVYDSPEMDWELMKKIFNGEIKPE